MKQTLKYIRLLNWAYGGFTHITLTPDYKNSIEQVQKTLALFEELSYDDLLIEATSTDGKANLQNFLNTDNTFEYGLHFMRDRELLLDALQPDYLEKEGEKLVVKKNPNRMIRPFLDAIDKYKEDGLWTDEQWREYRWTIETIELKFEDRLRQFAAAYDFKPKLQTKPQQELKDVLPDCLKTDEAVKIFQRAIDAKMIEKTAKGLKWNRTKQLLAYFATLMSNEFKLSTKYDKDGNITTSWKPFEALFGVKDLKGAKQNWMKTQLCFKPTGFKEVDELFRP